MIILEKILHKKQIIYFGVGYLEGGGDTPPQCRGWSLLIWLDDNVKIKNCIGHFGQFRGHFEAVFVPELKFVTD